jgi:hypothetical protein
MCFLPAWIEDLLHIKTIDKCQKQPSTNNLLTAGTLHIYYQGYISTTVPAALFQKFPTSDSAPTILYHSPCHDKSPHNNKFCLLQLVLYIYKFIEAIPKAV